MSLDQEQFDILIPPLEKFARQQPAVYKLQVALLAILGYLYIFIVLAILLGLFVLIVYGILATHTFNYFLLKLAIVIFIPISVVLRSLWVTFPQPQGLKLHPQDVPHLFALVDQLSTKLKAPKLDHILLTAELNAAIIQRPRLGLFGWQENYLVIGLPLMQALSPEQLSAVLAHELGHLSGNHSRFGGWVYLVQKTYYQIFERLQGSGDRLGSLVLISFFNWYAPFFTAYSFVLRRMNEYEADRCSAELAGVENTAQALITVDLKSEFLQNYFWPSIYKQIYEIADPPTNIYTRMSEFWKNGIKKENISQFLPQILAQRTDNHDTHPCLTDRLQALGYPEPTGKEITLPQPFALSAASEYLGNALENLTNYWNSTWLAEVQTTWRQKYAQSQGEIALLTDLERKIAENQYLSQDDISHLALLKLQYRSQEDAIPWLEKILATTDDDIVANYTLGQVLLEQNHLKGIEYIEKAIAQNPDLVIEGCNLIYSFLRKQGNLELAKVYKHRAQQHYELVLKAQRERSYVSNRDKFQPHNLSGEVIENLSEQLADYPNIKKAYFAEKIVQYFPEQPCYVLLLEEVWGFIHVDLHGKDLINKIIEEVEFPGLTLIILLSSKNKPIQRKLLKITNAVIYQKKN